MIRVLIVDDHPIFRSGFASLIQASPGMQVAAEVDDGLRALRVAQEVVWEVAVLDVSMPRLNGIEVLRRLKAQFPERPILILSQFPESQFAARVVQEGAAGYLSKSGPPGDVIRAIARAASGMPLAPSESGAAGTRPGEPALAPHETLTARESEIFLLIALGRGVTDVAAELNVAPSTVSNHLARIKEKLNVTTVGGLVAYAHRSGLLG